MAEYLYRGAENDMFADEIYSGVIDGAEHPIYRGSMFDRPRSVASDVPLDDLDFYTLDERTVHVTGGVSSSLAQTRRFTGSNSYAMVLDAHSLPFEEIEYSYEWFNDHPGAYNHIRSASKGELRVAEAELGVGPADEPDLVGTVKRSVRSSGERIDRVSEWRLQNGMHGYLPGTGPRSRFAEEKEWVAFQPSVNITGSIEGAVSVVEDISIRSTYTRGKDMVPADSPPAEEVIGEVYQSYRELVPRSVEYYLVVVDDFQHYKRGDGGWLTGDINIAYTDAGMVAPEDVPAKFRGRVG